jgi:hypothetical protein
MAGGAFTFIAKPFPITGRTLTAVIREVLDEMGNKESPVDKQTEPNGTAFAGGALILFEDRAEFLGKTICFGPRSNSKRIVLKLLAELHRGKSAAGYSGAELRSKAKELGAKGESAGLIRDLRDELGSVLRTKPEVKVDAAELILSNDTGYRLSSQLTVQFATTQTTTDIRDIKDMADARGVPNVLNRNVLNVPNHGVRNVINHAPEQRATWILKELGNGGRVSAAIVANRFECGPKTGQRDLGALKEAGLIEFVGSSRSGEYRLVRDPPLA